MGLGMDNPYKTLTCGTTPVTRSIPVSFNITNEQQFVSTPGYIFHYYE